MFIERYPAKKIGNVNLKFRRYLRTRELGLGPHHQMLGDSMRLASRRCLTIVRQVRRKRTVGGTRLTPMLRNRAKNKALMREPKKKQPRGTRRNTSNHGNES